MIFFLREIKKIIMSVCLQSEIKCTVAFAQNYVSLQNRRIYEAKRETQNTILVLAFFNLASTTSDRPLRSCILKQSPESGYTDTCPGSCFQRRYSTSTTCSVWEMTGRNGRQFFFTYQFWLDYSYDWGVNINIVRLLPVITHLENKWN